MNKFLVKYDNVINTRTRAYLLGFLIAVILGLLLGFFTNTLALPTYSIYFIVIPVLILSMAPFVRWSILNPPSTGNLDNKNQKEKSK